MNRSYRVGLGSILLGLLLCVSAEAQSGLRESLERLDINKDGVIDPDEITPLARPYFEQLARSGSRGRRFSLDRSNEITALQEIARLYYADKNGTAGEQRVSPQGENTVLPFGTKPGAPIVPEFGLGEMKFPYTQDDLDFADRTLRSHDENRDGFIDREEAAEHKWTHRNPFDDDLNTDDRLSRLEMAQRYARRRLLDQSSREFRMQAWRKGEYRERPEEKRERRDESQWWRQGGSDTWLTASLLGRFDANKNGRLEAGETNGLGISLERIDADRDGEISRDELLSHVSNEQSRSGGGADSPPGWFFDMDQNRDGQVSMLEYTTDWTDEKLLQFSSFDLNGDGLLTGAEASSSKPSTAGTFRHTAAELLPPRKSIVSEIDIDQDILIADLNVQLSITHTNVSFLDGYLTGPDGQRIELFTAVGGTSNHFDQTVFDDQSQTPITKSKPPFSGSFLPEGVEKGQLGLSHFNGKNAKGTWQITIRGARSDRFGLLNSWSLMIRAQD